MCDPVDGPRGLRDLAHLLKVLFEDLLVDGDLSLICLLLVDVLTLRRLALDVVVVDLSATNS